MIPNSGAVRQLTELGFLLVTATENPAASEPDPRNRRPVSCIRLKREQPTTGVQALEVLAGLQQATGAWTSHSTSGGGQ